MNEKQRLLKLLLQMLRGAHWIAGCFVAGMLLARYSIHSTTPVYESVARLRLDDQSFGISNNNLYKDFDVFSTKNKIETEVATISSPVIVGRAVDALGLQVDYFRVGRIAEREIYGENPFTVRLLADSGKLAEKKINIQIALPDSVRCRLEGQENWVRSRLGEPFMLDGQLLVLESNDSIREHRRVDLHGLYYVRVRNREGLVAECMSNLDVVAMDKETPIVRVGVQSHSPIKAASLANAICQIYMEDYVRHKSQAAQKTLAFIDEQIEELALQLSEAENQREGYRRAYGITNTLQETETALRKVADLEKQQINLDLKEHEIQILEEYIREGHYFHQDAPPFGFGDLTYTEIVKKLALYRDERIDLLQRYQADHPKVQALELKMKETAAYVREALATQRRLVELNKSDLATALDEERRFFEPIPTREKELHILERRNALLEADYNFLTKKRAEAAINAASGISFHRVIQTATPPKQPIKPNTVLINFLSGLFGILAGIGAVLLRQALFGKVRDAHDLQTRSVLPVLGAMRPDTRYRADYDHLVSMLELRSNQKGPLRVVVSSLNWGEGKSGVASNLAAAFERSGWKTVLLKADGKDNQAHDARHLSPAQAEAWLALHGADADRLVVDCRSLADGPEVPGLMQAAGIGLLVAQTGITPLDKVPQADDWSALIPGTSLYWSLHIVSRMTRIQEGFSRLKDRFRPLYQRFRTATRRLPALPLFSAKNTDPLA